MDEMGPAEFGLLMGEEGNNGMDGASRPLLADDWVRQPEMRAVTLAPYLRKTHDKRLRKPLQLRESFGGSCRCCRGQRGSNDAEEGAKSCDLAAGSYKCRG